ncbi:hypothetical protein BKA70DRAFT_1566683 [Coprinopsis sp. MPI-PUGE-AT-0042]|nr:hypothetical protein BKA70DRAFT_1566683 [Coprinopsis sp. MPI-PUGE-AT-0042]
MEAPITFQTGSKSVSPELFVRNASSLAAFVFVFCEYFGHLDDEFELIWRGPLNWVKGLYLLTRYTAVFTSIANMAFLFCGPLRYYPNNVDDCRRWFVLFACLCVVPVFAIDGLSLIRIYVLHGQDFRIGSFASSLICTEAILVIVLTSKALESVDFTPTCEAIDMPHNAFFYGAWVVMTQLALIWLTFHKLKTISGKLHQATVYLVLYQGMWLCGYVVAALFVTLLYSTIKGTSNTNVVAIWPGALATNILCRVILNLRRGPSHQDETLDERTELQAQFTSWFSSASEGTQEFRTRDGASTLRRRFPLSVHSEHNNPYPPTRSIMNRHSFGRPGSPLSKPVKKTLEAGISLSDVGLQGALATIPSSRPNSIQ